MNDAKDLQTYFCPFGHLDIKAVCEIGDKIGIDNHELFKIIYDFKKDRGLNGFDGIDPVSCVLEHILRIARDKIEELTGYNFMSDSSFPICTHSNFLCSSYYYSDDAVEELKEKVSPNLDKLMQDKYCRYFLSELDIGVD